MIQHFAPGCINTPVLRRRTSSDSILEMFLLSCFSLLLLLYSYIMACLRRRCPSAWLLKCLFSAHREIIWPCPLVNGYRKEEITHSFQKAGVPRSFTRQLWSPSILNFLTTFPSQFCLFHFISSSAPISILKGTWHPDPNNAKCWAGWSTGWNQYCWEKYQ